MAAVAVSMIMEEEETEDVRCKAKAAYDKHQLRIGDFLRFDESLDCFEEDGKAQGDEEYAVDEGT